MTYNPAFSFPASALTTVPAHSVFNGRISYETADKDWVFTLSGTNLFNKFYYYNKFSLTGFNVSGTPSRPREWMVTVRKNF
jgi:iron complex outermembrane receptor protein